MWLLLATEPLPSAQPRSPWKEGGEGKPLRRHRHTGSAAHRALAPACALRSLRALTAAVRHEGLKGSSVGGVADSEASNHWRPLRMQHGSSGSKPGFIQSAGEEGEVPTLQRAHRLLSRRAVSPARAPDSEPRRAKGCCARGLASRSPLGPLFSSR